MDGTTVIDDIRAQMKGAFVQHRPIRCIRVTRESVTPGYIHFDQVEDGREVKMHPDDWDLILEGFAKRQRREEQPRRVDPVVPMNPPALFGIPIIVEDDAT